MTSRQGKFFAVGVGPGDPELLTIKAVRTMEAADVIAFPAGHIAGTIAGRYLEEKTTLPLPAPMIEAGPALTRVRRENAERLEDQLRRGNDVAFLTVGDPTIYSTALYLLQLIRDDGFAVEVVPGVPAFCAAAAALGIALCEEGEALHIFPGHYQRTAGSLTGTRVFMKAGSVIEEIKAQGKDEDVYYGVTNLGMAGEQLFRGRESLPAKAGYFTTLIIKEQKKG